LAKIRHAAATASGKRAGMTSVGQAGQRITQMARSAAFDWELASRPSFHTGKGTSHTTSASTHLYWGRGWYVWNNTGDQTALPETPGNLDQAPKQR
jgi:hypothetical protein